MRDPKLPKHANALQRNIYNRMRELGLTMRGLSDAAGLGETAARDIIVGRSKRPSWRQLDAIAKALGRAVADIAGEDDAPPLPDRGVPTLPPSFGEPDLPIVGTARGGEGILIIPVDHAPIGRTFRPPQLRGVVDAFAVICSGDSMDPRYKHGQTLLIHPHEPVGRENGVLVVKTNDEAIVKEMVKSEPRQYRLLEYQPKRREFAIPAAEVRRVYRIIGALDLR